MVELAFLKKITEIGQKGTVRCAVDQNGPSRETVRYATVRYVRWPYCIINIGGLNSHTNRTQIQNYFFSFRSLSPHFLKNYVFSRTCC